MGRVCPERPGSVAEVLGFFFSKKKAFPLLVTILGCGGSAGVPHIGGAGDWGACNPAEPRNVRTRSSIIIQAPRGRILVDTGPDLRGQLLACQVPRIEAIIYTHAHADHVTGLDDVRLLNRITGAPIPAFATAATVAELERRFDYAFRPWTPPWFNRPVFDMTTIAAGDTIATCGAHVRSFDQDHHVMRSLGLRVGGFAYSTDVVRLDDAAFAALDRHGHLAGGLLPAPAASDTCPCGSGSGVARPAGHPQDGADPYGQRHGLGLAARQSAAGRGAGI